MADPRTKKNNKELFLIKKRVVGVEKGIFLLKYF